jgi:glycosyltransferase involved in cell wall biosynthesis
VKALAFVWHPPEGGHAGGFVLAERFFALQSSFDFTVVASDSSPLADRAERTRVVRIPERRVYSAAPRWFAALRAVNWAWHSAASIAVALWCARRERYAFVFVPSAEIPCNTLAAVVIAAILRVPLVLSNLNVRGVFFWKQNRVLHRFARGIVTISRALASEIRREVPRARIFVFAVGADDGSLPRMPRPAYDAVFVGRHVPDKGTGDLLAIWQRCCARSPGLRLAMAGPCEAATAKRLRERAEHLGIGKAVTIFGTITERQKWELYANARVCAFPSYVEGWGIVPLEAQLAGLPVVAYRLPAYDENIAHSPATTLVQPGDLDAFSAALLRYLDAAPDPVVAAQWAGAFSWPHAIASEERAILAALAPA